MKSLEGFSAHSPLKVLRVVARLNVGGPARQTILLHHELTNAGFHTLLAHGDVGPGEATLEDLLSEAPGGSVRLLGLGPRIRPLDDLRAFVGLVRLVFAERPDVVHTHTAKAGTLGRLAAFLYNSTRARSRRCLVVHTYHGHVLDGYFGPLGTAAVRTAERALARISDIIVTISPRQRDEIVSRYSIAPAARVQVVRLGLRLDEFFAIDGTDRSFRLGLGLPADSILFACVGRLVNIKSLPTMIEAFDIAVRAEPALRLVIVGDGVERPALESDVARRGLKDRVRFLGWRRDLPQLYGGVDALALSSRNEGTPVALIEAMASGRPVVATAVGGIPDFVTDDSSGLLVPPGDPMALARAILRLAASPETRAAFGEAGRQAARAFDWRQLVKALTELYVLGLSRVRRQDSGGEDELDVEPDPNGAKEERSARCAALPAGTTS